MPLYRLTPFAKNERANLGKAERTRQGRKRGYSPFPVLPHSSFSFLPVFSGRPQLFIRPDEV
jgi:hypothetical protein